MPRHSEKRILHFTPQQMYSLVADIESYPEFLPWCVSSCIREKMDDGRILADLVIGYKAFRERFTSCVTLEKNSRIAVEYVSGPLSSLRNEWTFEKSGEKNCEIGFLVDFSFRSRLLGAMMDAFFDKAFRKMVRAFEERAEQLYGVGGSS